jgi:hypothetical protein
LRGLALIPTVAQAPRISKESELANFAELKLLIDEFDPVNSDWNFRKGILLDILVRIWPQPLDHAQAPGRWTIQESVPSDGFECYYLLRDGDVVAEICGPQSDLRKRHLYDLVAAAAPVAGRAEPVAWMVERKSDPTFPRLFDDETDAVALVTYVNVNPPATIRPLYAAPSLPTQPAREEVREALEAARPEIERQFHKCGADEHAAIYFEKLLAKIDAALAQSTVCTCGGDLAHDYHEKWCPAGTRELKVD